MTTNSCISYSGLQQLIARGEHVTIIDVRSGDEFEKQHIPGAIHIPLAEISAIVFPKESLHIITVCGKGGGRSQQAAALLKTAGYTAQWLCNGTDGWPKS